MALFRRKPDKNTVELTKESALAKISDFFTDPNQEVERFLQNLKTDTPTQQFNSSVVNKIKQMTKSEHSRDFIARVKALENAVPQEASVLNIPMIPQYATFRLR